MHAPASSTVRAQVTKALAKKLKLTPAAAEALAYAFIEAQMAFQFRHSSQLPISIKDRPDTAAQLVDLANAGTFSKEAAEDLVAFLHSLAPADLAVRALSGKNAMTRAL